MKRNNIIKGLSLAMVLSVTASCSDNYLNVQPTTEIGQSEVSANVETAKRAINGICNSMQTQYQKTDYNQYNGESYVNTNLNDAFGPDYVSSVGAATFGNENMKMTNFHQYNYVVVNIVWNYCYNLINQANVILDGIDNAEGDVNERDFVKAQALTFRAFAYSKLLMFYAPRWEDSNNGAALCAVLRLKPGAQPIPLCSMNAVFAQIYKDLDEAIELYKNCGVDREFKWQPNLSVAYGVYARAALVKNDWKTAQSMAHEARQGYTIMDNDTYLSGFCDTNDDFMWEQAQDETSIYYWSWGSHYAINGRYNQTWGLGTGAISVALARELDPNDIRLQCFITPDKVAIMNAKGLNKAKVTEAYFYDEELVDLNNHLNLAVGFTNLLERTPKSKRYGLYNFALNYIAYYCANIYKGNTAYLENEGFYPYFTIDKTAPSANIEGYKDSEGKSVRGKLVVTPFGAQLKFTSVPPYGVSSFPFMRAAEMCLAEAEAAYHNGDYKTAQSCLNEINGMRIPGYTCTSSGNALFNEIKLCRRIELWGEGQNWSDWKRWNSSINRVKWENGNVKSGNWPIEISGEIPARGGTTNCWTMSIPSGEVDYNDSISRADIPMY